jgi:MFS family permease
VTHHGDPAPGPLAALRDPNFARLMAGVMVSTIGSWMQNAAVPFALYTITKSATWVGLAAAAQFLPSVPLAPVAAALADRCDRRAVLLVSQVVQLVCAVGLWIVWVQWPRPGALLALVALGGTANLVVAATNQAFVSELVPGEGMLGALTVNSAQANVARALGPSLGGVLIASAGVAWVFAVNAVSFLAVIGALWTIRAVRLPTAFARHGIMRAFGDAVSYSFRHPVIAPTIVLTVVIGAAVYPVNQMAVVMARQVFEVGPRAFGILSGAFGAGAVLGAIALSWLQRHHPAFDAVPITLGCTAMALVSYAASPVFAIAVASCAMVGAGALIVTALLNTRIQRQAPSDRRGSVLAVWVVAYNVAFATGSLLMGRLAEWSSVRAPMLIAGLVVAAATLWAATRRVPANSFDRSLRMEVGAR